jgi:hypothetical protein
MLQAMRKIPPWPMAALVSDADIHRSDRTPTRTISPMSRPTVTRAVASLAALCTVAVLALAACSRQMQEGTASSSGDIPSVMPLKFAARPTVPAITPGDLMSRLYVFADDSMAGREAGEPGNDKGTAYIEAQLRGLGLEPAGENGTFFQQVMVRRGVTASSPLAVDGRTFALGTDLIARDQSDIGQARSFDGAQAVFGGQFGDTLRMIPPSQARGRVLIFAVPQGWQANRGGLSLRYPEAAAIVIASLDAMPAEVKQQLIAAAGPRAMGGPQTRQVPSFMYASRAAADAMLGGSLSSSMIGATGRMVRGAFTVREDPAPGRNVIAILRGSDPALRGQYVVIGAHNDHVGKTPQPLEHDSLRAFNTVVRPLGADSPPRRANSGEQSRIRVILDSLRRLRPARPDSVFNGADDDGSGSVAVLEIAEAMAKSATRPRRSIIFIWHTAEELGLFGSQYFTEHPTVPRDSMVAGINIDMIGRGTARDFEDGGPGYLQLIGSRRLSTEFGNLVEQVNTTQPQPLKFDYQFDAPNHPQQFYCRSDHYNYARWGIPVVFFSTGSHPDYHQLTDEPQYIAYEKLTRVTQFIHDVTLRTANLDRRPVVDKPKPDPHGQCRQ